MSDVFKPDIPADTALSHVADSGVNQAMKGFYALNPMGYRVLGRLSKDHPKVVEIGSTVGLTLLDWGLSVLYTFLPGNLKREHPKARFVRDFLARVPRAINEHFQTAALAEPYDGEDDVLLQASSTMLGFIKHLGVTLVNKPSQIISEGLDKHTKKRAKEDGVSERVFLFRSELVEARERRLVALYREGDDITRAVIDSRRAGEKFGTELKRRIKESGNR